MNLIPFDPELHTPQDVGLGGPSTEVTVTLGNDDIGYMVVPSLWWDDKGKPFLIEKTEDIEFLVNKYEKETGKQFPRFSSSKKADSWAAKRSKAGGASTEPLAKDIKEQKAKVAKTFKEAL